MEPQQTELQLLEEAKIVTPLTEILGEIKPSTPIKSYQQESSQSLKKSLDDLFPEQRYEEKDNQKAKAILGELVNELTTDEFTDAITELKFLCETWLDDFERELFDGLTLKELLHEKGRS